jgi:uncharacterized Zn finger protein (UPF0148 family)
MTCPDCGGRLAGEEGVKICTVCGEVYEQLQLELEAVEGEEERSL